MYDKLTQENLDDEDICVHIEYISELLQKAKDKMLLNGLVETLIPDVQYSETNVVPLWAILKRLTHSDSEKVC